MNHSQPEHVHLVMDREVAAHLYNLLSDNPRAWNSGLRIILSQTVSATEAMNALAKAQGRK